MKKEIKEEIEDWEKEFDNLTLGLEKVENWARCRGLKIKGGNALKNRLKSFIRQLLSQREKEILEEIEKLAEKSGYGKESYDAFIRISQIDFDELKQKLKKVGKIDNYPIDTW